MVLMTGLELREKAKKECPEVDILFLASELDEVTDKTGFNLCAVKRFRVPKTLSVVLDFFFTERCQVAFIVFTGDVKDPYNDVAP